MIKMDGFVIELDVDADEQLMVSREEPYKPPDYRYYYQNYFLKILISSFALQRGRSLYHLHVGLC